jgi:GT2 family glycosyltransferase
LTTPSVALVIPVWNQVDLLRVLLKSIADQTVQPARIVIVDNASTEDIASIAAQAGAQYLRMPRNLGFAAAVNRGIALAQTEWIALLNSDVALQPDWLEQLLQRATAVDAWYACGKLLMARDPTRIDGTWDLIASSGCAYRNGQGRKDGPQFSPEREIALCPATAAIYRRELFDRVGGFAEVYESYLEDVDFSMRCAAAGYRGFYVPKAQATHVGQGSSSHWSRRVVELNARNQVLLVKRLYPLQVQKQFRWKIIAGQFLWGLVACRHFRLGSWVRGRLDGAKRNVAAQPLDQGSLTRLLAASEREIRGIQKVKPDLYWRLYFLITGPESE